MLNDCHNEMLFLVTGNANQHVKIYLENQRAAHNHERNTIEKEDRESHVALFHAVVFKKRAATKSCGSSTTTTNTEAMLLKPT